MLFLGEDFDQVITLRRKGHLLRAHCFDEAVGGDLTKFSGLYQVGGHSRHSVYPCERGTVSWNLVVDPITSLETIGESLWVPGEAINDGVSTGSVDDMGVYLECREALPFPVLSVP